MCSAAGYDRDRTSLAYALTPSRIAAPTWANCFTNFGRKSASGRMSSRSCSTSTWPSVAAPEPMPIVGIVRRRVMAAATGSGTHSSTIEKQPAAWSATAES